MTHALLALQAADTLADQLRHRRQHLPGQAEIDAARADLGDWERRRDALRREIDALDAEITRAEAASHEIDVHRARLDKQLKTVIAPREAEALMHEIAVLEERRGALDDEELAALERQAELDTQLAVHLEAESAVRDAAAEAEALGADAIASIDHQLAALAAGHDELRVAVDPDHLRRYDGLRSHQMVAAAALNGTRCEGCHLDLSASELDEVKGAARQDGLADCPHCGRILIA